MGRARGRSSGRISISRGRSIELPDDVQPILERSGVDGSRVQQLEQQISQLQNEKSALQNRVAELEGRLQNTVPLSDARNAVQQAFNAGVQRVIDFLKQRGIL